MSSDSPSRKSVLTEVTDRRSFLRGAAGSLVSGLLVGSAVTGAQSEVSFEPTEGHGRQAILDRSLADDTAAQYHDWLVDKGYEPDLELARAGTLELATASVEAAVVPFRRSSPKGVAFLSWRDDRVPEVIEMTAENGGKFNQLGAGGDCNNGGVGKHCGDIDWGCVGGCMDDPWTCGGEAIEGDLDCCDKWECTQVLW
jgi:hypothetical protein